MTLYLIPTPIGNLADITYRSVEILKTVDIIYAEDTRTSKVLLDHYYITTPLKSYHQHNEKARSTEIIKHLKDGKDIAVISDAGTPGISDPSNTIVKDAIAHGIQISPLPGPTALIPALIASGFDTSMFYMAGFLPKKPKEQNTLLQSLKSLNTPIIFYEAPHRLQKTLSTLQEYFGNADISIARELTKIYESFYRGKLNDILQNFTTITLKGEFVIVILPTPPEIDIIAEITHLYTSKYSTENLSTASKLIATELGISKKLVYETLISHRP